MKRAWIGMAILSVPWLLGLEYYHDPGWITWVLAIVGGVCLFLGVPIGKPTRIEALLAAVMLVPAVAIAPWPYRAAAILALGGLLLVAAPVPRQWPQKLGGAAIVAGIVLAAQALGLLIYTNLTARSHDLPGPLARATCAIARFLGVDAALDGSTMALGSIRRTHLLGATWELLLGPTTVAFVAGGVVLLLLRPRRFARSFASAVSFVIVVAAWLPIRSGLMISLFAHRALRTAYDAPLDLMNQFWSPWLALALLAGPVWLATRCFGSSPAPATVSIATKRAGRGRQTVAIAASLIGAFLLAFGMLWSPSGPRKHSRIWVDEHRSNWERTDRPYDPNWYGQESGYNYACIYDYCSRFYDMDRLETDIDANTLADCDVLVVKIPTIRYDSDEIAEIERFVNAGGGLLLIGEHTNVFNSGTYLNDIAARFGFRFRYDCLFDIDMVFDQLYRPPLAAHPIVQHMPPMDFAVSCSIAPGSSPGRAVIQATGLRSMPADYHVSNYYPQVEDRPESRYGAFIQLWTTSHGAGRVAAFADSTIFSNFSTFEPGKAELMLGMLEWLNHEQPRIDSRPLLMGAGAMLLVVGLLLCWGWTGGAFVVFAAGALGLSTAVLAVRYAHAEAMPAPTPVRPFTHVVMDRTVCDSLLSKSGFIAGEPDGFGIFERWVLRLGYFTSRQAGSDAFAGHLLIFAYPNQEVPSEFRQRLQEYVAAGGRVLVLDSLANTQSTADALLHAFGLKVSRQTQLAGVLETPPAWPATVLAEAACQIEGGTPLISIAGRPVAATASFGQGSVTVVGFGSRFCDAQMGVTGDVIPAPQLRQVYELQFRLLRHIVSPD